MNKRRRRRGSGKAQKPEGILRAIPLGGLGEIGKNMMFLEYITDTTHDSLIIDSGIMFPENDMLGIDYIIPDFEYILDKLHTIRGVIITHGHEDHTGSIAHTMDVVDAPIYASQLTRGLLEIKLKNAHLLEQTTFVTVQPNDKIQMGIFLVEFFHVCHSIPDSLGVGIETPLGMVIHTGDYKFDHTPIDGKPTDFAKLADFANRDPLLLLADSTNADSPGWTKSESIIQEGFETVFSEAKGRIMIATFASLISRIQLVADTAKRHNRKMAVTGFSMVQNVKMARKLGGYLDIPDNMLVDIGEISTLPPEQVVIMITGAQGEPAAGLSRLATDRHRQLQIMEGDTVMLSASPIPGNEEMVSRTINRLMQRGANVIYHKIAPVHVSGHASQEEMKLMLNLIKPRFFIPVHGELRHLRLHAQMAMKLGIPKENIGVGENGTPFILDGNELQIGERIPGGYIYVDGTGVGDIGPAVIRERDKLARDGFITINLKVDKKSYQLIEDPEFVSRGFIYLREAGDLLDDATRIIEKNLGSGGGRTARAKSDNIQKKLEKFFYNEIKRRPMIFVFIYEF